jgi:AcrR family transcriptional regulator
MSPRSQEQIDKIRKQSIRKILESAFQIMAKNGYDAASISQIASHAGVSKGLMYNYFESKEALLKALIYNAFEEADAMMGEIIGKNPAETIENMLRWYFRELRERPEHWRLITELTLKIDKFDFVKEMARNKLSEYVRFFGELLKEQGFENAENEARLIAGLFDGIGVQYLVIGQEYPLDEMEKFLIEKYCRK